MSGQASELEIEKVKTESVWKSVVLFALLLTLAAPLKAQVPAGDGRRRERAASQAVPTAQSLTLEQLLQIAHANNPTLGQAQAGIRESAGRTLQAGLWPNPTVGYACDEIRGGLFGGGEQGVFIQQNIILGGKLGLDRKISAEEGKQTEAAAEAQPLRVENGVRIAFYQSLAAQEAVEVRLRLSGLAKDGVETTQQLFNVGQADQPDLLQAQVEADEADLAVITARQDQQRGWRVLSALVGMPTMPLAHLEGDFER